MNTKLLNIRKLILIVKRDNVEHSTLAMLFSSLVYFSDDFIHKVLDEIGAVETHIAHVNGLKAFRTQFRGIDFVAFRGTESSMYSNWKRILNFIPKKTRLGRKAHRGFVMAFEDCRRVLELNLIPYNRIHKTIFCGHSLGGAMALLAVDAFRCGMAYTFASPQVFFNEDVSKLSHVGYRVVGDFIPHLPVSFFFLEWSRPNPQFAWMLDRKYLNPLNYHNLDIYISYVLSLLEKDIK